MQRLDSVMTKELVTVKPRDTIAFARKLAVQHRVNQFPVVQGGKLVGILTDRDLRDAFPSVFDEAEHDAKGVHADAWTPDHVRVESVMSRDPHTLAPEASLADAARLMRKQRIGSVPVVDAQGHLLGLITRSDVLDAYIRLDEAR
ncbi:MAG: CBS domain-containing protein [bacterium]